MELNELLKGKGIKYILVIAPNKHTIYFEQLPSYFTKVNNYSATDQVIGYLKKHTDVTVIDLRGKIKKEKEIHQVYYKVDTHWNHYAANIAQYEIMKVIESFFPDQILPELKKLKKSIKTGGDLANFTGVKVMKQFKDFNPQPIFENDCSPSTEPIGAKGRVTHTLICGDQNLNAIIFRDSFFTALQPYFSRKLKRSTYIWKKLTIPALKKYIEIEKPNIVIEEWIERSLPYLPKYNMTSLSE